MAGAPSQLELFDDKPKLSELSGKTPPKSLMEGRRFAFLKGNETLLGSTRKFDRYGECGMDISEMFPHHRKIVDEVCLAARDDHRRLQPRPGQALHEHRLPGAWPPEHGLVGDLRPRQRIREPARIRRPAERAARPARRELAVVERLPPHLLPGRAVPRQGRSDPQPPEPGGLRTRRASARFYDAVGDTQPRPPRRGRRPRDPHPHQRLRDGLPHADAAPPN